MVIEEGINTISYGFQKFIGESKEYVILYVLSILFACMYMKEKNNRAVFVNYAIITILIVFNPIIASLLDIILEGNVYFRMFWMMPNLLTIAYVFTEIVFLADKKVKKVAIAITLICLIMFAGEAMYADKVFEKVNNWAKMPDEEMYIINTILAQGIENPKVFVAPRLTGHIRQITSKIELVYMRTPSGDYLWQREIRWLENGVYREAIDAMRNMECDFLVWNKPLNLDGQFGLEILAETPYFFVYRINEIEK